MAVKLENDPELLESFFALQMEVEELRKIEDNTEEMRTQIVTLEENLAVKKLTTDDLEAKINSTLEQMKTASNDELKTHLEELEKQNLEVKLENEKLQSELNCSKNEFKLSEEKVLKLETRVQESTALKSEAKRNPKRAATAVSAAVVRGSRMGNKNNQEIKQLKSEINRLQKVFYPDIEIVLKLIIKGNFC